MQFCLWFSVLQLELFVFIHILHYVFISEQYNKWNQHTHSCYGCWRTLSCSLSEESQVLSGIITDSVIIKTCHDRIKLCHDCQVSHLIQPCPRVGRSTPLSLLSIYFLIFSPFTFPFPSLALLTGIFLFCPSLLFLSEYSHSVSRPEGVESDQIWV